MNHAEGISDFESVILILGISNYGHPNQIFIK